MKGTAGTVAIAWLSLLSLADTAPSPVFDKRASPTVSIESGTIVGSSNLITENFNGIPFAQPPTGSLRLKPPVALTSSLGTFDATGTAASCPQLYFSAEAGSPALNILGSLLNTPIFQALQDSSEDCLTITVVRPAGTTADDNLPVLYWIYGGGFQVGASTTNDGTSLVGAAASLGKPYIFVTVNYRLGGFGFLPGAEVLADVSANLGLLDQRMGLKWVADNVAAFGGDPTKVTIWGQSAGAISVYNQLALYDGDISYKGKDLFRGAIMNSGSVIPADPVDCPKSQAVYDAVVATAGCSSSSDTLDCLRGLDYETYLHAANSVPSSFLTYSSIALSYLPRPDGIALRASPEVLVANGQYAAVPMIIGSQEDEGTAFSLAQSNITTTDDLISYLSTLYYHGATTAQITELVATYPASVAAGSPFNTGTSNEIYPGYKRLAALLGDISFTLMRRVFLKTAAAVNPSVPTWSFFGSFDYGTPILGTAHSSEQGQIFNGIQPGYYSKTIQSYYANFVYNLDPNDATGGTSGNSAVAFSWPQWASGQQLLHFLKSNVALLSDNFRSTSYNFLSANLAALHL